MFFKQLASKESSLSYFFGCAGHGLAVAVDVVAGDEDWFIEQAKLANVQITHVIDTHVHADHYTGGRELARRINAAYCLHENARHFVQYDFTALTDNQMLAFGNVSIRVLHTPGHSLDSLCLLVSDARRSAAPWFVITGDTLFVGAVGRPDLSSEDPALARKMAGMLYDSLHQKLLSLPDDLEIFPGHQAGSACGVGLSGKPSSTIGFEKRWNTMLAMERELFIQELSTNISPRPTNMDLIVATNISA